MHIKMLSRGIFVQMKILGGWNAGLETYQVQNTNDINVSCVFTAVKSKATPLFLLISITANCWLLKTLKCRHKPN